MLSQCQAGRISQHQELPIFGILAEDNGAVIVDVLLKIILVDQLSINLMNLMIPDDAQDDDHHH